MGKKIEIDAVLNNQVSGTSKKITGDLKSMAKGGLKPAKLLKAGMLGVTAAIGAVSAASIKAAFDVAKLGDEIDKQSQKVGLSAEAYQQWDHVLNLSGTSMEKASTGLKRFQKNALMATRGTGDAARAFQALGINTQDVNGNLRSNEDLMGDTIRRLADMDDVTRRNAMAQQLFGEAGAELAPLLNNSSEEIDKLVEGSKDYVAFSQDSVDAAADFTDAQYKLGEALQSAKVKFATPVVKALTPVFEDLAEKVAKLANSGLFTKIGNVVVGMGKIVVGTIKTLGSSAIYTFAKLLEFTAGNISKLKSKLLGTVRDILDALPDFLVPDGWVEGLERAKADTDIFVETLKNFSETADKDLVNSAVTIVEGWDQIKNSSNAAAAAVENAAKKTQRAQNRAAQGAADATGIEPAKSGKKSGGDAEAKKAAREAARREREKQRAVASIRKHFMDLKRSDQEKELNELQMWYQEQKEIIGTNDEAQAQLLEVRRQREKEINDKYDEMARQKRRKEQQEKKDLIREWQNTAIDSAATVANTITSLSSQAADREAAIEVERIKNSKMAEEEKEKAIEEIRKRQFKKNKRAQIANILINSAAGVAKTIANVGFPAAIPLLVLQGVQTAAAIATAASAKFARGGIVPGNQTSGDNVIAGLNSGEMVLNKQQQSRLFAIAEGRGRGTPSLNIGDTQVVIQGNADAAVVENALAVSREKQISEMKELLREMQYTGELKTELV